jgi:hypothetical protein
MSDSQLIEQLAVTDLYRDDVALPKTMRSDVVLLDITRRMGMDTKERTQVVESPRRRWNGMLVAAAAFGLVIIVGLMTSLLTSTDRDTEPANTPTTEAPPTTVAAVGIDIGAAAPVQVQNDQASRAIIDFAGNAQALVEGGAHIVDIQMDIEADFVSPGVSVRLLSIDGEITSTGITENGDTFTPTWAWTPDGDKVVVTMVGRGVTIADTRPAVVVSVQDTASSDPVEFVLTAAAGSGRSG